MNKGLLKAKIYQSGDTLYQAAEKLEMSKSSFSFKVNGKSNFTASEMKRFKECYNATSDEIVSIFLH